MNPASHIKKKYGVGLGFPMDFCFLNLIQVIFFGGGAIWATCRPTLHGGGGVVNQEFFISSPAGVVFGRLEFRV